MTTPDPCRFVASNTLKDSRRRRVVSGSIAKQSKRTQGLSGIKDNEAARAEMARRIRILPGHSRRPRRKRRPVAPPGRIREEPLAAGPTGAPPHRCGSLRGFRESRDEGPGGHHGGRWRGDVRVDLGEAWLVKVRARDRAVLAGPRGPRRSGGRPTSGMPGQQQQPAADRGRRQSSSSSMRVVPSGCNTAAPAAARAQRLLPRPGSATGQRAVIAGTGATPQPRRRRGRETGLLRAARRRRRPRRCRRRTGRAPRTAAAA